MLCTVTLFIVPLYTLYYDIIAVSDVNIVSIVDINNKKNKIKKKKKGWILEVDLEHDAQNSYPLAPEKKVIKSEMSGYQKCLMADLNLDPPNSKTLVLTLCVKLRAALHIRQNPCRGCLVALLA